MKAEELREIVAAMTERPWHLDDDTPCAYAGEREVMVCGDEVDNYDGDMPGVIALANHATALVELVAACEELHSKWPEGGCVVSPACGSCAWCTFSSALAAVHAIGTAPEAQGGER